MRRSLASLVGPLGVSALALSMGCGERPAPAHPAHAEQTAQRETTQRFGMLPSEIALAATSSSAGLSDEIGRWQRELRADRSRTASWERLGWLFVAQARRTRDEGFYVQAEACAACLEELENGSSEAALLRGHVAFARHDFARALALADPLCERRGAAFDHGLRGDALLELGRLDEAESAYQRMLDTKPCLQSYARAGVLCAMRGELERALELLEMASKAASPRDGEAAAWAYGEWARFLAWNGETARALRTLDVAESYLRGHAPTALLRARLLASLGERARALDAARAALRVDDSVEARWIAADLLRESGDEPGAAAVERALESSRDGHLDARASAHYLAVRGRSLERAVALARGELETRDGAATRAALAFALHRAGAFEEARVHGALAAVTRACDPRIHLVLAICSLSDREAARAHLVHAEKGAAALLPSERVLLAAARADLPPPAVPGARH